MNRRKFVGIAGVTLATIGSATYLLSDNHNIVRSEMKMYDSSKLILREHEQKILYLASLAPSSHNTALAGKVCRTISLDYWKR